MEILNPSTSIFIRFFLAILYIFVVYYNEVFVVFGDEGNAGGSIFTGKYTLLTNLNIVFLCGCLIYSSLCCLLSSVRILHYLNGVLAGTSATMSLMVSVLFWTLFTIDRELVYPAELDNYIPVWHNHALHTVIVPASVINYCLVLRRHSPSLRAVLLLSVTLALAYVGWIHVIHQVTGWWVYPILQVLSAGQRGAFIGACALSVAPFTCAVYAAKSRFEQWNSAGGAGEKVMSAEFAGGDHKRE